METHRSEPMQEIDAEKLEHPAAQSTLEPIISDAVSANETDSGDGGQPSPEFLQRKLYFLVEHLKTMHSKLPE